MTNKYYNSLKQVWVSSNKDDETFETEIRGKLKSALQMPNIMVLAGSGTSLGNIVKGPRMWDLWEACTTHGMLAIAHDCFAESQFDSSIESNQNIEVGNPP